MSKEINHDRRRFLGTAIMTVAAAELVMTGSADARSSKLDPLDTTTIKPGTNTSFGSLKQIDAGVLNVGCAEAGPADGPAVIFLHGWPYDIHSFVDVAPLLAAAGYNHMEGIHHESKQALAGRDTRQRKRGADRDLSRGQKRGAADDALSGSIAH